MKLTMLGTGNASAVHCYNTCFVLESEAGRMLVDAGGGNGIFRQLSLAGMCWQDLHTIYVTHQHLDHLLGVYWLIRCIGKAAAAGKDIGQFSIWAHSGLAVTLDATCRLLMPVEYDAARDSALSIHEVTDGMGAKLLGCQASFFDMHSRKMKQFGFRMEYAPGKTLVCCGDEPLPAECRGIAQGADWLLHEAFCLSADEPRFHAYEKSHSTVRDACTLAQKLAVKNLVLYHTEDEHLKRRRELYTAEGKRYYGGNLYVPEDLEEIRL